MNDVIIVTTKTKSEAQDEIYKFKARGFTNIALIGPIRRVEPPLQTGPGDWVVIGTSALITIGPKD